MGIDPGTMITGYGIIESQNGRLKILACDAIVNTNKTEMPNRLSDIFVALNKVIKKFSPNEIAIETAFYGKNAQSALKLGQARGIAMLAATLNNIPITEYSPREVKKSVVGNGAASKEQVQYMVKSILRMPDAPKHYDTTDALAVAICHSFHITFNGEITGSKKYKSWKSFIEQNPNLKKE